mmetsp:Transcript_12000/g.28694  ORF Transcript_12000/g.28694 Transcript_12000/m.28694 type:complete len:457 (+) Transcript_12000:52-1422(+)
MVSEVKADVDASTDTVVANELSKLTLQERELAYEDLHAVSDVVEESPELIERCLVQLHEALRNISDKQAYDGAMKQSQEYVWNHKFCLKFLRGARFDPGRAAERIVEYFRIKLRLFGIERLSKEITLHDLGEDGMEVLKLGAQQILPSRDSTGRAVVVGHQATSFSLLDKFKDPLALQKALWYTLSTVFDDEETQRRGVVFISYAVDSNAPSDGSRFKFLRAGAKAVTVPGRVVAGHYCYSSSYAALLWKAVVFGAGAFLRVRLRAHCGTHSECIYSLLSYGIPVNDFPISETGELKLNNHLKWIERRRKKELFLSSRVPIGTTVDLPARYDVLLGRGRPFNQHWGNRRLHDVVADRYDEYNQQTRANKTQLAQEVVDYVHNYGGRFLKQCDDSGMWMEVCNLDARNKVGHAFRRAREYRSITSEAKPTMATSQYENVIGAGPERKRRAVTPILQI